MSAIPPLRLKEDFENYRVLGLPCQRAPRSRTIEHLLTPFLAPGRIEVPMTARIAAFFDLDNTITPGSAIELKYFRHLWRHGLVGVVDGVRSAVYLLRCIPPLSFDPLRRHKAYLSGKSVTAIEAHAQTFFWKQVCPRISQAARHRIDIHRAQNHRVVLLTGCPDFLVEPLATFLKVDDVMAGQLDRCGTVFTGKMIEPYPYREGKLQAAQRLASEHGIRLEESYMYGDSPGDLSMLEAVGHPRVVNPIRGMKRVAIERRWPILDWH